MRPAVKLALRSLGFLLLAAVPAHAIPFTLQVFADGVFIGEADQDRLGCVTNPDGVTASCSATDLPYGDDYTRLNIDEINLQLDSDPVVTGTTTLTNVLPTTQQITLLFTLPVTAIPGATLTGGSFRATATDRNGDGVTLSTAAGSAFYTALLDGVNWQSLYADPQSFSAGGFGSATIPQLSFGSPIPSLVGPAVAGTIGIKLDFLLTGFDSGSVTSNHVVVPVPEPQTALLLGFGLAFLASRRRR
jgi:hypothetical protein